MLTTVDARADPAPSLPATTPAPPPSFKLTRFDEDYRWLSDPAARVTAYDRIKYVPLIDGAWLSLGGEVRERVDVLDAARFGIGASSETYVLQRMLVHADLHIGDYVRAFVQLGREDAFGRRTPSAITDANGPALQNAFVDLLPVEGLIVRAGRQELTFDPTQRFVSVREGPNVRQAFDGVRVIWDRPSLKLDVFATRPVLYRAGAFNDVTDRSQRFYGVHASRSLGSGRTLDAYAYELDRDGVRYGSVTGDERRSTFGLRTAGAAGSFDWDVEGALQRGRFSGRPIRAAAAGAIAGFTLRESLRPRLGVELDYGSGDRDPSDGSLGTFNPLFPKGAYFNEAAITSWSNLIALRPSLTIHPTATVSVSGSLIERWRAQQADAVYVQPAIALPGRGVPGSRRVGSGWQFDAAWRPNRFLVLSLEAVHQEAGRVVAHAGGRSVDFLSTVVQFRF